MPAMINRMVNKTRGSADRIPNFPAVDADAQSIENKMPVMIKRVEDLFMNGKYIKDSDNVNTR